MMIFFCQKWYILVSFGKLPFHIIEDARYSWFFLWLLAYQTNLNPKDYIFAIFLPLTILTFFVTKCEFKFYILVLLHIRHVAHHKQSDTKRTCVFIIIFFSSALSVGCQPSFAVSIIPMATYKSKSADLITHSPEAKMNFVVTFFAVIPDGPRFYCFSMRHSLNRVVVEHLCQCSLFFTLTIVESHPCNV